MSTEMLTDSNTNTAPKADKWLFEHLPAYAVFLKENCLEPYVTEQLAIAKEIDLPMLKYLTGISDEDLFKMSMVSTGEYFSAVEHNKLKAHVDKSLQLWIADGMGIIKQDEISAEDILLAGYLRKKTMLKFLPSYTTDVLKAIEIIKEIDELTIQTDIEFSNVYITLLKNRIQEQALFTEVVANTTPGINYTFHLLTRTIKYANKNFMKFFGYSRQDIDNAGDSIMQNLIYAEDIPVTVSELQKFDNAADGEIISWELRLKAENGTYVWMKNYSSVFKRNEQGKATEIVGIILDISTEKDVAEKLLLREQQLLDAQAQAQVGSFELDVETGRMEVTPQFKEIYELSEFDLGNLIDHVHPADRARINANRDKAINDGTLYDNEYRYLINGKEKIIRSRGYASVKNGRKILTGTAADVTDRHSMVKKLLESEEQSHKAQEMAHIGNWRWNLVTNECTWSNELFRIYEMDIPDDDRIDPALSKTYRHPDDTQMVDATMALLMKEHIPCDYIYRIIIPASGKIKYLNVKANVFYDEDNIATDIYGTVQDITEKQTLIEQLQESEQLFKEAQARTHIGNWTWDIAADKVTWSDEMFRVYGLEPQSEEVNYETYISHIHPDDREERVRQVQLVLETGKEEDNHYRIIRPDGSITILHTKSELQRNENGIPIRMTGTCQDVTEKQLLIEKLQRSEQLYKQAQSISHIGNWAWDMKTKHIEWSDEIYHIYELELQSLSDTNSLDQYNHPGDSTKITDVIREAVETNKPFDFNYRIVLASGKVKTLHAKGEVLKTTGNIKIYGTLQDITEQKAVEKQIQDYKEFIEKITDVTPSIIASYNIHTGKYSFVNDAIEKMLGYPASKILAEGLEFMLTLLHPDDIPYIMEKNTLALAEANKMGFAEDEPITEFKYRMRNTAGEYRWFHTYGTIFERNEKGEVESVLNVSVDITDQEVAEQLVYQKNLQLQRSNTSLEEYAYVASHDLKEPLRKIATFSDRILTTQYDTLNADGQTYLNKIIDASKRMQKMVSDLLSVSTISGNVAYETCDLKYILTEALVPLEYKIEESKAIIETDDLPSISAVPSQFMQLFQNLVSNSLKFAREGVPSHIKITHKYISPKAAEQYNLPKAKKYLQLQLKDNGIGFANEYAGKIFAIFQRLHGKTEYEGTGIGLAICKKIIENHGGLIFAEGEPGQGAVFTMIIPVS